MDILIIYTIKAIILPPGINIFLLIIGLALLRRRRLLAIIIMLISVFSLYILSMPYTARGLGRFLETYPALTDVDLMQNHAQAIVVLSGGRYSNAPEYGGDTIFKSALDRLRYAAYLYRKTGLPILLSGGSVFGNDPSEAYLMKRVMIEEFHITRVWTEEKSRNTAENAIFSAQILKSKGISSIYLVTHALHMRRAVSMFEKLGFKVIPAPTIFIGSGGVKRGILDWLPSVSALEISYNVLHEYIGQIWYKIRY